MSFIDYEKTFDRLRHYDLMEVSKSIDIDGKDMRMIKNLYWKQQAAVRVEGVLTEYQDIKRGLRKDVRCHWICLICIER